MSQDFCTSQKSCCWRFLGSLSSLSFTPLILIPNVWFFFVSIRCWYFLIWFYFWLFCWFWYYVFNFRECLLKFFHLIFLFCQVSPPLLGLVLPVVTLSNLVGMPKRTCYTVKYVLAQFLYTWQCVFTKFGELCWQMHSKSLCYKIKRLVSCIYIAIASFACIFRHYGGVFHFNLWFFISLVVFFISLLRAPLKK